MNISEMIRSVIYYYQAGDLHQAKDFCEKILKIQPDNGDILYFLGIIYAQLGNNDLAIQYLKKSLQFNESNADAYFALGIAFEKTGNIGEAITFYQKTIEVKPNYIKAYENLGNIFKEKGLINEAIIIYEKAVNLHTDNPDVYNSLGNIFIKKWRIDDAIALYQQALQKNPADVSAYNNLGNAFQIKGDPENAEMYYRHAVKLDPDNAVPYQNLLFVMNYNPCHKAKTILAENLRFAKRFEEPILSSIYPYANERSQHRRLKIGYVSPDFKAHSVSCFIEPVIAVHNKEQFEIFCYSLVSEEDEVTERFQKYADHWRNITGISDEKAAEFIRDDGIDILIDLAGHTTNNRILLFVRKPAPIQVSWLGYLATTGLSSMDYKIVDNYSDPPAMTEQFYTEKLIRLPESFLCYLPVKDGPEVGELPALKKGYITFGSFNNFVKVSPDVISSWSRILQAIPNSRLIMRTYNFCDRTTRQHAMGMFMQRGIAAERITLLPWEPSPKHLESYNLVDIGLDTFPFNGGATTCEAIWMGVPVVTHAGSAYHSRVGVSLLSNIGLKELIGKTYEEYIEIAVNLAHNIERLKALRESLRDMMLRSPLTDAKRFTVNLEKSYRRMWEEWCKSA